MTRVSVCVPTYNGERFVEAALNSVLGQTLTDFELLVCDDASTDGTRRVVEAIRDPRLRLEVNERRLGLVGNWNRCLELAHTEYVSIFHQDDLMAPDNVRLKVEILDRQPNVGFAWSNMTAINECGEPAGGHWVQDLPDCDTICDGHEFFWMLLQRGNVVPCQSVMMRSHLVQRWGGFDDRLGYTPDLEMWLRMSLHGHVGYLAQPLVAVRRHEKQESSRFIGGVTEINEVWEAVRIIFCEHRRYISQPDDMYQSAMSHLEDWLLASIRVAARSGSVRLSLTYLSALARCRYARQRGLGGLTTPSLTS